METKNQELKTLSDVIIDQSKEILKIKVIIRHLHRTRANIASLRHPITTVDYLNHIYNECSQSAVEIEEKLGLLITPLVEPLGCGKFKRFHLSSEDLRRGYCIFSKINTKNDDFILPLSSVDNGLFHFTAGMIAQYPSTDTPLLLFKSMKGNQSFKINEL